MQCSGGKVAGAVQKEAARAGAARAGAARAVRAMEGVARSAVGLRCRKSGLWNDTGPSNRRSAEIVVFGWRYWWRGWGRGKWGRPLKIEESSSARKSASLRSVAAEEVLAFGVA